MNTHVPHSHTRHTDTLCLYELQKQADGKNYCTHCQLHTGDNADWEYALTGIHLTLVEVDEDGDDDGNQRTAHRVQCYWPALKELLQLSVSDILRWNMDQRQTFVRSLVGKRFRVLLVRTGDGTFRLDGAYPL